MTFRPTLIERAYQLAESGSCENMYAIKNALSDEGFTMMDIQMQLNGLAITRAIGQKCRKNYIAPPNDDGDVHP